MFLSKEAISASYTRILHMYSSTYLPKPEEIREKVNACFYLMHRFKEDVFKKACSEWVQIEKRMPSPIDLRDKCVKINKELENLSGISLTKCSFYDNYTTYVKPKYEEYLCGKNMIYRDIKGNPRCEYHYTLALELSGIDTRRITWLGEMDGEIKWTKAELMRIEYEMGNVDILNDLTEKQKNYVLMQNKLFSKKIDTSKLYKTL